MGRLLLIFIVVFFGGLGLIIFPWYFVVCVVVLPIIGGIAEAYCEIKYGKRWLRKLLLKEKEPKDEAIDDFEPV